MEEKKTEKIQFDIVITWVDWTSKKLKVEMIKHDGKSEYCEDGDFTEIKYLIRSLEKNNVKYRKIFVVHSDHYDPPSFLIEHDKLSFIQHSQIVDTKYLPLIHRESIVASLHKIPELSKYYFYLQDNLFVNDRRVFEMNINNYFEKKIFIERRKIPVIDPKKSMGLWFLSTRNSHSTIAKRKMKKIITFMHAIQFFDKEVMEELEMKYKKYFTSTISYQNINTEKDPYLICATAMFSNYLIYEKKYQEITFPEGYSSEIHSNNITDSNFNEEEFMSELECLKQAMIFNAQGNGISGEYPKCEKVKNIFYGFIEKQYPVKSIYESTYVYFTAPYETLPNIVEFYSKITPGCKGIWKNIVGTLDIEKADYIVVLDDISPDLISEGIEYFLQKVNYDYDKIIFFDRENISITKKRPKSWFTKKILPKLKHNCSTVKGYSYTFANTNFINKTYDELKSMEYPRKDKLISAVVSSAEYAKTYTERKKFLIKYSENNTIDIFGRGWDPDILGKNYKGELGCYFGSDPGPKGATSKTDGLLPYKYSIALQNFPNDPVISEKFTDVILLWSIPIWSGSHTNPYPKDSYLMINVLNFEDIEKIREFIKNPITKETIEVLKETRNLILDKHNIWEHIYQIIKDFSHYQKEYKTNCVPTKGTKKKYKCSSCDVECNKLKYMNAHIKKYHPN